MNRNENTMYVLPRNLAIGDVIVSMGERLTVLSVPVVADMAPYCTKMRYVFDVEDSYGEVVTLRPVAMHPIKIVK